MPNQKSLAVLVAASVIIFGSLATPTPVSAADREKVLYAFKGGKDGVWPSASLIFDAAGNLYGTTPKGGNFRCDRYFAGCGTVFKLEPVARGQWRKTILHTFRGTDGAYPGGGLIFDSAGNLYGTTISGGGAKGWGTVFKLSPGVHGTWTETVLHIFNDQDGGLPAGNLIFDAAGNLYGITQVGGKHDFGNVFKLAPGMNGKWTEIVLHSFNGNDGNNPTSALIFDSLGNLYGSTLAGGDVNYCAPNGCGTVFKLVPGADGRWTHTVLHSFTGKDGSIPSCSLVFDTAGNLYGTTVYGGNLNTCVDYGCGTVFRMAPDANGKWTETVLHAFNGNDGSFPYAGLILDANGNLYGTTWYGTNVFKLAPGANGKWTETVLLAFNGKDGWFPGADLVFDTSGNLYGTTEYGGKLNACHSEYGYGCGVVFEITP